jgi:hypothetical protein
MDLTVRSESWSGRGYEWLHGEKGTDTCLTVTLDLDLFDFGTIFTDKILPAGMVLGKHTVSGKYGPYDGGSTGVNEKQTITITGTPTGGTFTVTLNGVTSGAIDFDATAAEVDAALEAMSNIDAGEVSVTGGPGPGTAWVVEFTGDLGGTNVSLMTATGSFTGGTDPAVAITTTTSPTVGASDGRDVAQGILFETVDCSRIEGTDLQGERVVPMMIEGFINESKLPTNHGLDSAAKTDLTWFRFF